MSISNPWRHRNGPLEDEIRWAPHFSEGKPLEVRQFRDAPDALRALFDLERRMPDRDIVLVRADTSEDVRLAFKSYFSDARDFIRLIEDGCAKLTAAKTIRDVPFFHKAPRDA